MIKKIKSNRIAGMIGAFVVVSGLFVTNVTAAAPGTVSMTVTAVGKKDTSPPLVTKDDVQLYLNKERTQIADWKHGGKLYLAVLIDDSPAASKSKISTFGQSMLRMRGTVGADSSSPTERNRISASYPTKRAPNPFTLVLVLPSRSSPILMSSPRISATSTF